MLESAPGPKSVSMAVPVLARHIRDTYYSQMIQEWHRRHPADLDETVGPQQEVTPAWIDAQERRWQRDRAELQALEHKRTDPADDADVEAARRYTRGLALHLSPSEVVALWDRDYRQERASLDARLAHVMRRSAQVDPRLPERDLCDQHCLDLRWRIRRLPLSLGEPVKKV